MDTDVPVTAPTPLLMLTLVAPDADQESVVDCPWGTLAGLAEKEEITGADTEAGFTVTVAGEETVPPEFVTVRIYVVVWLGETDSDPVPATDTPSKETEVAPVLAQESVADCPAVMVVGEATKEVMLGGVTGAAGVPRYTVMLAEWVMPLVSVPETVKVWAPAVYRLAMKPAI
jgi:hypothetical protein